MNRSILLTIMIAGAVSGCNLLEQAKVQSAATTSSPVSATAQSLPAGDELPPSSIKRVEVKEIMSFAFTKKLIPGATLGEPILSDFIQATLSLDAIVVSAATRQKLELEASSPAVANCSTLLGQALISGGSIELLISNNVIQGCSLPQVCQPVECFAAPCPDPCVTPRPCPEIAVKPPVGCQYIWPEMPMGNQCPTPILVCGDPQPDPSMSPLPPQGI